MAIKAKKNKRSLVTCKRTEPSRKEQRDIDFTRAVLTGEIDLDALKEMENLTEEDLEGFPSIDELIEEMKSNFTDDVEANTKNLDDFLNAHTDHPQFLRLQLTLMKEMAKRMSDDEREQLIMDVSRNTFDTLEPDDSLNDKIMDTAELYDKGRTSKALKNITACLRRIEDKKTPHEINGTPVYSISFPLHEYLYKENQKRLGKDTAYLPAPASYDSAYRIMARLCFDNMEYDDAMEAAKNAVQWNPCETEMRFLVAHLYFNNEDYDLHKEALKEIYPLITDRSELAEFYMEWASAFDNEGDFEMSVRLLRISNHIYENATVQGLIQTLEEDELEHEVAPLLRAEMLELLKKYDIPFGLSDMAKSCMEKYLTTYEKDEDQSKLTEALKAELDYLSTCLDDLETI